MSLLPEELTPYGVSLRFPAEPKWLALCRLVLGGVARVNGVDDETVADLKLAVTEACSNAVRHAYRVDEPGEVTVRFGIDGRAVRVEVTDTGGGFEHRRQLRELDPERSDLREDEMGLAIIRTIVDELEIGSGPERRGTRLAFRKTIPQAEA
jgi:serine/threonine-protein kinase RsbW